MNERNQCNQEMNVQKPPHIVIFFDTETNGISYRSSVLSISAIKGLVNFETETVKILDTFERYYYPVERYNWSAIRVNKLKESVITNKRGPNCNYPMYFQDDQESFELFSADCDHYVAHNIEFDRAFLRKFLKKTFCTMKTNLMILKSPSKKPSVYKWPSLVETAAFYEIQCSKEDGNFHESTFDAFLVLKIFEKMLKISYGQTAIHMFLYGKPRNS